MQGCRISIEVWFNRIYGAANFTETFSHFEIVRIAGNQIYSALKTEKEIEVESNFIGQYNVIILDTFNLYK